MAEDAPAAFKRVLREVVGPALRELGLRGSGQTFVLPDSDHWAQVGFQKSWRGTADVVTFTINLTVTRKDWWDEQRRDHSPLKDVPPPGVDPASWDSQRLRKSAYPARPSANGFDDGRTMRIGHLIPGVNADHWWSLTAGEADIVVGDALDVLIRYGLPWLRTELGAGTTA